MPDIEIKNLIKDFNGLRAANKEKGREINMLTLTDQNFEQEIQNAEKPVLVDFYTLWCQPCFILSPILEKLANEFEGKLILAKVNLDTVPLISQKYGIEKIPTVIFFKEGKPVSGFVGVRPEAEIRKWLEENLKDEKEKIEKVIQEYEEYAKKNNLSLNPNRGVVERIVKGLLENEKKYGARYCPCRKISGNPKEDKAKICPCAWHHQEIKKDGHCLCGLFVR